MQKRFVDYGTSLDFVSAVIMTFIFILGFIKGYRQN